MAPWTNKTGLAKATAILATVLGVSIGLCGANFVVVISWLSFGQSITAKWLDRVTSLLAFTAWIEAAAIVISLAGLFLIALVPVASALGRLIFPQDRYDKEE